MKIFKIQLLLFLSTKILACDMCGNFMGITPYDNQSQVTFLHRYRVFNGYRNYQQVPKFFNAGAYRIAHDPGTTPGGATEIKDHSSKDYETYKVFELRAKYFLHPRWEINVIAPLQQIRTKYDDVKTINTSLSDPSFFAAYHLLKHLNGYELKQRLIIGGGVKLPLGNYKAKTSTGQRMFLLTQNGTGSFDHFYYVNYIVSKNWWGFSTNSLFKINGTNSFHERMANSFNQIISLFAKIQVKNVRLFPSVLMNYENNKGMYYNKKIVEGTNTNVLLVGPSLDINYKKAVLNLSYQFNAYERVSSQELSNAGRFVVGLTFNFSQSGYLFNSKK